MYLDLATKSVKISEFGCAREVHSGRPVVAERVPVASPAHAAVELLALSPGDALQDPCAADVWACGVLLWELWARAPPFVGLAAADVAARLNRGDRLTWPRARAARAIRTARTVAALGAPAAASPQAESRRASVEQQLRMRRGSVRNQAALEALTTAAAVSLDNGLSGDLSLDDDADGGATGGGGGGGGRGRQR